MTLALPNETATNVLPSTFEHVTSCELGIDAIAVSETAGSSVAPTQNVLDAEDDPVRTNASAPVDDVDLGRATPMRRTEVNCFVDDASCQPAIATPTLRLNRLVTLCSKLEIELAVAFSV